MEYIHFESQLCKKISMFKENRIVDISIILGSLPCLTACAAGKIHHAGDDASGQDTTCDQSSNDSSSSSSDNDGLIVGVVVGIVALIGCVWGVFVHTQKGLSSSDYVGQRGPEVRPMHSLA